MLRIAFLTNRLRFVDPLEAARLEPGAKVIVVVAVEDHAHLVRSAQM
jgi:hypothetical protein